MTAIDDAPTGPDATFRCAPWTQAQGVDPVGSAPPFDCLLLVEWPLPWPADVSEIPELAEAGAHLGVRLMIVVPRDDAGRDGLTRVVHRRRTATNHLAGVDHLVPMAELPALLTALLADPLADHLDLPSAVGEAPR